MRGVGHLAAATRPAYLRTEVKEVMAMFGVYASDHKSQESYGLPAAG
jgi:hypothetical protein